MSIKQGIDAWLPVVLTKTSDGTDALGVIEVTIENNLRCYYRKATDGAGTAPTQVNLTSRWRQPNGGDSLSPGYYEVKLLGSSDLDVPGFLEYFVMANDIEPYKGLIEIEVEKTNDVYTSIGAPVALDGGSATIASMLTKMADNNSGASYRAVSDSLNAAAGRVTAGTTLAVTATSGTLTTGTNTSGNYTSTFLSNGTYWTTAPVTPAVGGFGLNEYLAFPLPSLTPVNISVRGFYSSAGGSHYVEIYAWNWNTSVWDQLSDSGTHMANASVNATYGPFVLLANHKDPVSGAVRISFKSTDTATGYRLNLDQVLVNGTGTSPSETSIANAVYLQMKQTVYGADSAVYIDTTYGTAGTVVGTNGTAWSPVSTYADALVLAAALPCKHFYLYPGTAITLTQSHAQWRFEGPGTISLNGQSIEDATFYGVYEISGTAIGDDFQIERSGLSDLNLDHGYISNCIFRGTNGVTITPTGAEKFLHVNDCSDAVSGGTTSFTFTANAVLNLRGWHGGVRLKSLASTNEANIDGAGRVIFDASCVGGVVKVRGNWTIEDYVSGGFPSVGTLNQVARWGTDQFVSSVQGNVTGSVASVTGAVGSVTGAVGSVTGAVGSVTGNIGGYLTGNVKGNVEGNVVGSVASVTGAVGSVTGNVGGSVGSVTGAVGSVTGAVGSVTGAVGSVTGAVGSVTGAVTVGTNSDKTGYALTAAYDSAKSAASEASVATLLDFAEGKFKIFTSGPDANRLVCYKINGDVLMKFDLQKADGTATYFNPFIRIPVVAP